MAEIPNFQHTPTDQIPGLVSEVRRTFLSQKTKDLEYRLLQLRKFYWSIKDNEKEMLEAVKRDLNKSAHEAMIAELVWIKNDTLFMCNNLKKFAKEESAEDISFSNKFLTPKIRKEPMGTVLVIGAFNVPFQLSISPMIGAIAAGCTVVLKPSENAPNCAAVMEKIVRESLDPSAYKVIQGAIPETTMLLDQKWDKIFYTGGEVVGKIIAKKAAETLTPVILELGGRNPAIVTRNANARLAARRLLWGKLYNAGQICVSQNYTLIDKEIFPSFLSELKKAFTEFFPDGARACPDYGRIVNARQFQRIKKMLDSSTGKILIGGSMDEEELFFEPTVVLVDNEKDSLLVDESFGPLMPILPVENLDEAIKIANEVHDTPLGMYPFGNKADIAKAMDGIRSGGVSQNDSFMHCSINTLAFGGIGTSGDGAYRGKSSFDAFTHRRSVTNTPAWLETVLAVRYPPYSAARLAQFVGATSLKPNFDRNGRLVRSWANIVFGLGADSKTNGVFRWAVLVLVATGLKQYMSRRSKL